MTKKLNTFELIRQSVDFRQAAYFYGIRPGRDGKAICPFHPDRFPSLQVYDDHYHCFGCGAHGDVIDLVASLFRLTPYEAAEKVAADLDLANDAGTNRSAVSCSGSFNRYFQSVREQYYSAYCRYRDFLQRMMHKAAVLGEEKREEVLQACCDESTHIEQILDILGPDSTYPEEDIEALIKEKETEVTIIYDIINCFS